MKIDRVPLYNGEEENIIENAKNSMSDGKDLLQGQGEPEPVNHEQPEEKKKWEPNEAS